MWLVFILTMDKYESNVILRKGMSESFSTTIEWSGEAEIGHRLVSLIPDDINFQLTEDAGTANIQIMVSADTLEDLRIIVDQLLADFSNQDE